MSEIYELDKESFQAWLADTPEKVQDMAKTYPPHLLYELETTKQKVTIFSYSEDNTVTVDILDRFSLVNSEIRVFGIELSDLTECDLPNLT